MVCADAKPATPTTAAAATVVNNNFLIVRLLFSLKIESGRFASQITFLLDHVLLPQLGCDVGVPTLPARIWPARICGTVPASAGRNLCSTVDVISTTAHNSEASSSWPIRDRAICY
jgi:hypothetical protein